MATRIIFGTDGWRGTIAEDFTFENVRLCAQGVADYLMATGKADAGMVVGYDTRFASEHFAAAAAEVLAGNGIRAYLCDRPSPTPVISYSVLAKKTAGAINITASHNPASWNGFKVRSEYAGAATPETLKDIEARIERIQAAGSVKQLPMDDALARDLIQVFDPAPEYLAKVAALVDTGPLRQAGLTVVADSMWGAGLGWFSRLLNGGKTRVIEIHYQRNPVFPEMHNPEPIAANLTRLFETVRTCGAQVGIATDGDADRIGLVDENGQFINQLQVYALLALYLLEVRGWRGPIVKTISTTSMLNRLGEMFGIPVYETMVGFKYVAPKMMEVDAIIGGEESGGYAFRGHIPERDGIVAGLFLLDFMVKANKSPAQLLDYLFSKVGPHYYDRVDITMAPEQREEVVARLSRGRPRSLDGVKVVQIDTREGFRYVLADGSWLLVRLSGTEPLVRIYTEAGSLEKVQRLLNAGRQLTGV
jgi:phosphomannomutase